MTSARCKRLRIVLALLPVAVFIFWFVTPRVQRHPEDRLRHRASNTRPVYPQLHRILPGAFGLFGQAPHPQARPASLDRVALGGANSPLRIRRTAPFDSRPATI